MKYLSVAEIAKLWKLSPRTVRNYCANDLIPGAMLIGKTWSIPEGVVRPNTHTSEKVNTLLYRLREEKNSHVSGGIYHKIQVDMTYNSNHIEGSKLTHDQTRYIFETNTIGLDKGSASVDDIVETANHFRAIDYIIDNAHKQLNESMIKDIHRILKSSTSDSNKNWFAVGDYKKIPNEVGGRATVSPENVSQIMKDLITNYNETKNKSIEELVDFHYQFESIHPFQDGNGRVGRLLLFKECLKNNIVPFIIDDDLKMYYYRGLHEWEKDKAYLIDICLTAQDKFKTVLDYFKINY